MNEQTQEPDREQVPDEQELRRMYEEQQRRLACPTCGEEPFLD